MVRLVVLKSLYKGQTRRKRRHKIFQGQYKTCLGQLNTLDDFRYVRTFFKTKYLDFLNNQVVLWDEKLVKRSYFFPIFDLKSSVACLISIKMIKYIWKVKCYIWNIWNIFEIIKKSILSSKEKNITITPFETSFSWSGGKNWRFSGFWPFLTFHCKLFA